MVVTHGYASGVVQRLHYHHTLHQPPTLHISRLPVLHNDMVGEWELDLANPIICPHLQPVLWIVLFNCGYICGGGKVDYFRDYGWGVAAEGWV